MDLSSIIHALTIGDKAEVKKIKATLEAQIENKELKALGKQYTSVPKMFKESKGKCNSTMLETYIKYGDKFLFTDGKVMMIFNQDLGYIENEYYKNQDDKCFTPYGDPTDKVIITKQSLAKIKKDDYVDFVTEGGKKIKIVKRFADHLINFSDSDVFLIGRTPMSEKTNLDVAYQRNENGEYILVGVIEN